MADFWEGAKQALVKIGVPVIAGALVPGSSGFASRMASKILGCEDTPEALQVAAQKATPDQIQALKEMENRHEEKLAELNLEQDKIALQNTQSARNREMAIVQATGKKDYNLYILGWSIVFGFFGLTLYMMAYEMPEGNLGPVNQLFGALVMGFGGVVNYFFGSSKSSSDKNSLLSAEYTSKKSERT